MPEQALGWFPLGLGLVMEDEPSELSCVYGDLPVARCQIASLVPSFFNVARFSACNIEKLGIEPGDKATR